jgi:hypothetical protein
MDRYYGDKGSNHQNKRVSESLGSECEQEHPGSMGGGDHQQDAAQHKQCSSSKAKNTYGSSYHLQAPIFASIHPDSAQLFHYYLTLFTQLLYRN